MKNIYFSLLIAFLYSLPLSAQIGFGFVGGNDIYQRYTNPDDDSGKARSAGNAILNLTFGPKIWMGSENFSVSIESHVNWGSTSLSIKDYKGMGALAFPVLAKLNFRGNSGFNSELTSGFSIGGGVQWAKTEVYGLNGPSENMGVQRSYFPVAVAEVSYGYGISGFLIELFTRYGYNTETRAQTLNVGIAYNFNFIGFTKLKRKFEALDNM